MTDNIKLLNFIYKNAEMGEETLKHIYGIYTDNNDFCEALSHQLKGYSDTRDAARKKLNALGNDEKGLNKFEEIRTYLMINMKTFTDKSSKHLAEMLIKGSHMGVTDCSKSLSECPAADDDIKSMAQDLKHFEMQNVEALRKFV